MGKRKIQKKTLRAKKKKEKTNKKKSKKVSKKSNTKEQVLKKVNCSGNVKENDFTCYSSDAIFRLREFWNMRHEYDKILTNNEREIWEQLRNKMANVCNRESCWLRQKFMEGNLNEELINYTFAPKIPELWKKKPNTWLSGNDILAVMNQYEKKYPFFEFLGPSPIDFAEKKAYGECVWEELCNLNLHDMLKRSKKKLGIIFNTDPHTKPGEHWIALFIDLERHFIFYFDSVGDRTPSPIMRLIENVQNQMTNLNIPHKVIKNTMGHQRKNTECGIYCLFFINYLLNEKNDPNNLLENRIPDDEMEKYRKIFFNEQL